MSSQLHRSTTSIQSCHTQLARAMWQSGMSRMSSYCSCEKMVLCMECYLIFKLWITSQNIRLHWCHQHQPYQSFEDAFKQGILRVMAHRLLHIESSLSLGSLFPAPSLISKRSCSDTRIFGKLSESCVYSSFDTTIGLVKNLTTMLVPFRGGSSTLYCFKGGESTSCRGDG